ncbi:hypothetical protein [Streptomyces sp. NBC_01669]|uniref:hypothetical protein n=1 Tax=Streptomyces sp. NBC_01669 TaxID=2975909 RepID=UPI00225B0CB4|nr:hypothetical protein [Streptomyces sp. NBC_01669]MCX4538718.1 hypothetical protein [Streptomyces sp. NBC_01669]
MAATWTGRLDVARVLPATYAVFALAAGGRSTVQLATHASRAPLAYTLSALAALVYLAGLIALLRAGSGPRAHRVAAVVCMVELVGVVGVGAASLLDPRAFPDDTIWSRFGSGYGFVPAVLPVLALLWLRTDHHADSVKVAPGARVSARDTPRI